MQIFINTWFGIPWRKVTEEGRVLLCCQHIVQAVHTHPDKLQNAAGPFQCNVTNVT
jgi:hypothetical protein